MNGETKINEGIIDLNERKMQINDVNLRKLESVKEVLMLSNTELITVQMAADYFEVGLSTLEMCITNNREELEDNGYKVLNNKELKLLFENPTELGIKKFPNRGKALMTKRTLLNIGMLLKDSVVAKELRRRILDIVYDAETQTDIVDNVIKEIRTEQNIVDDMTKAIISGDFTKESLLKTELLNMRNKRIQELEDVINITINDNGLFDIGIIGKMLKPYNSIFGAKNIFKFLRSENILIDKENTQNHNSPYATYSNYFNVKLINNDFGTFNKTYLTGRGVKWLLNKIVKMGLINKENSDEIKSNLKEI